ncbi:MAG: GID complex subunit containing RING finger motif [Thelocarpon impressellum]|nr:MAG: GID complex subunit containing RING finger motif [Thelocarpon impressellum]
MAAELTTTKLNPESHLLLDQSLLRLPHELVRKNFKTSQRAVEHTRDIILASLRSTANAALSGEDQGEQSLAALDGMIARMQGLKRKLEGLHEEELAIHAASRRRIQHLQDLYDIPSLVDVKYDDWSRVRLNRLLVDYLLRAGYEESARALAREKDIEELVDTDVFTQCNRIRASLASGRTTECLAWCADNKQALRKLGSSLEFDVRLQQYIELVRTGEPERLLEATQHARKYLTPHKDTQFLEIHRAAGLLAFSPDTQAEPYKSMYSPGRWNALAALFTTTHHTLMALPARPLLHIALSAGLSSLKTPSCHASTGGPTTSPTPSASICPICSTELKDLARNVPYAHHTKSHVEPDPVVLPNGRVYGRERLQLLGGSGKGDGLGRVRDPMTGEVFGGEDVRKVYIS